MTEKGSVYLDVVMPCVPRLLGLLDRNPLSATYGCFDRNFWHYKIVDFSNGRQQEAALTLALLYKTAHKANPYFNQLKIKQWSLAAMQFYAAIQNNDGSFDEYYPHEHAMVTTAFSTFAVSEGLLLLEERPPAVVKAIAKAAEFLLQKEELEVVNQNLGAAAALYNVYKITGKEKFRKGASAKIRNSLEQQSPEGWFYEYGGPDIGYLSVAISYLAHYYIKSKDKAALSSLKKAAHFLSHFIHPDGTAGGEYGSRNTTYVVPDGIEICAQNQGYASYIAEKIRTSLHHWGSPLNLDDRYLCNMLYTYVQAFNHCSPVSLTEPEGRFFSESGLLVKKSKDVLLIANLKKGGVFKLFTDSALKMSDAGFMGRLPDKTTVTSQWMRTAHKIDDNEYVVKGLLVKVPEQQMTPFKTIVMRASLSVGQRYLSDAAKKYLRKRLITQKNTIPVSFKRRIRIGEVIHIEDELKALQDINFTSLYLVDHASLIYIPSSRYFLSTELHTPQYLTQDLSVEFNKRRKITLQRDITCDT